MKTFIKKNYLILLAILFCEIIFVCFGLPVNPDDYWWHVKIGEWICQNHSVQRTEIYSWAAQLYNSYWIDHSWLSEIFMYLNDFVFKNLAPLLFLMVSTLLSYVPIFKFQKESFKDNKLSVIIYAVFYFVLFQKMLAPRPYIFGMFFLVALIYELEKIRNNKKINYLHFAAIFILWTNMHGATAILGIFFIIYYLIFSLLNVKSKYINIEKQTRIQTFNYLKVLVLNMLCIFINPYGHKSVFYVFSHDEIATKYINEWNSAFELKSYFIMVLCAIALFLLFKKRKEISIQNLLVILGLIVLSLYCIRYIMYLIAFVGIYLIPLFARSDKEYKHLPSLIRILGIMSALLFVLFLISPQETTYIKISDEMIEKIEEESPERIYNEYGLGGYLIYKDIPVWWDARADLYRDNILLESFLAQLNSESENNKYNFNIDDFLDKYNFDYILISNTSPMIETITDRYELIFSDKECNLYKQKAP